MISITGISVDYVRVTEGRNGHLTASDKPVVSWAANSTKTGDRQASYRLKVGKWNSGWVKTADNFVRLPAGTLKQGVITDVSLQIRTEMGDSSQIYNDWLCNAAIDWNAKWITAEKTEQDRPVYIRKGFNVSGEIVGARIYAAGLGYHSIYINGEPIDESMLDPANVDYSKRVQYVMIPDAEQFRYGANEINVIVAPGWRGNTAMHAEGSPDLPPFTFEGPLQFSAIIEIDIEGGKTIRIVTDETWEAGTGPIVYSSVFNGETYDATVREKYASAVEIAAPGGKMEPMLIPPIVEMEELGPVAMWPDGENAMVFDFGRNIAGVVRVLLPDKMKKGQKFTLHHSEELTEDGKLFRDTLRTALNEDVYIACGTESDLDYWESRFTYHGFRYARLEGIESGFPLDDIYAVALRTDVDLKSGFTCGNPLISKIHDNCVNTERANIHSILTDCPQRNERLGWMNDATVRFEETPYNFDVGALFPKVVRDIIDAQGEDGAITCTAPFVWGSRPADPVCSSFLVAGYEAAMHTGNLDIIAEAFDSFAAWENCLLAHSDDYIVNYSYYGDWAGPADCCVPGDGVNPGAQSAVTPGIFMSTGYSYFNCTLLEKFATWLGKDEEAKKYADLADKVKNAMLNKWYEAETGNFGSGSQACLAFALWLGIAPEPAKTAKLLNEAVEKAGNRITTGNLCSRYIMDALTDNGYLETAWMLMTKEDYPSIGYMIQQEATTVWERFELMKAPGMNSHNHPMYGAVDYWMYAYLAGVKCTDIGWKKFSVKPYLPEKLMSAQATIDTVLGPVCVRWTKRYGGKHLQVNVPFGAEAEIDFCGVKKTVGCGFHTITVED